MPVIATGIRSQTQLDDLLDFSGTIAAGGTAQLVLPQQPRRLTLFIQNISASDPIVVGIGPATATASLTSTTVSSIAVANGGIGYTVPPKVRIFGGIVDGDYQNAPQRVAQAHAVLTGTAVSSIVVDDPGNGYLVAPYVYLENPLPQLGGGAKLPSATSGIILPANAILSFNGAMLVPTSAIAIFGPTTANAFTIKVGGLV